MVKNNAGVSPKGADLGGGFGKAGYLRSPKGWGEIPSFIPQVTFGAILGLILIFLACVGLIRIPTGAFGAREWSESSAV